MRRFNVSLTNASGTGSSEDDAAVVRVRPVYHNESETMELRDTIRTYRLFSGSYDFFFGPVFHPGRKDAVRIANDRPGQRILEVGVGTGLSLPHFRPDSRVTGIDVSAEMLAQAKRRTERMRLTHVEGLYLMDAENLTNAADFVALLAER